MLTKFTALAMGVLLSVSVSAADMTNMVILTFLAHDGDADSQSDLAHEYYKQGDYAEAFEWATKAANQGHADAQGILGLMYDEGKGVRKDRHKAFEWTTKAANQGNAGAQFYLGMMYESGYGVVRQDKSTAKRYYRQACDNGYSLGCNHYNELD